MTDRDETVDPSVEALIGRVAGDPRAMLALARTLLLPNGKRIRAREVAAAALALAPNDNEIRALARGVQSHGVGAWYFTMVQDHGRHERYAEAFRKAFEPGCTVLDIGAGTGLFAMLAAREGAAQVVACERNPEIARAAERVIERNGFADRVRLIAKDSVEVELGVDLDGPVDVLLWDNLANDLLGAGALGTIEDAHRRLLKPGAKIIPARCEIRVALAEGKPLENTQMDLVDGFDMSAFNSIRPSPMTLGAGNFVLRSEPTTIFNFDFTKGEAVSAQNAFSTVTASGGSVAGIAQWLRFHLFDDIVYDTGQDEGVTAFGVQYHAIEPFETCRGQELTIGGGHDRLRTWFWVE